MIRTIAPYIQYYNIVHSLPHADPGYFALMGRHFLHNAI